MVAISLPRYPPASASQSAGITGMSHHTRPVFAINVMADAYNSSTFSGKNTITFNVVADACNFSTFGG